MWTHRWQRITDHHGRPLKCGLWIYGQKQWLHCNRMTIYLVHIISTCLATLQIGCHLLLLHGDLVHLLDKICHQPTTSIPIGLWTEVFKGHCPHKDYNEHLTEQGHFCYWTGPPLVEVSWLLTSKPLHKPMLHFFQPHPKEQGTNFCDILIRTAIENTVCKMVAISFRHQCKKSVIQAPRWVSRKKRFLKRLISFYKRRLKKGSPISGLSQ